MRGVSGKRGSIIVVFLSVLAILVIAHGMGAPLTSSTDPALAYEYPTNLAGTIYSVDASKRLLFRFKRTAIRSVQTLSVQRDFADPNGNLVAQEKVVYDANALVSYQWQEPQTGAFGTAAIRRSPEDPSVGTVEFKYVRAAGERPKVRSEPLAANTLMADMVGPFLTAHWNELQRGEKVPCRYLVISRTQTVGFVFSQVPDASSGGQNVTVIKMEPSSSVVALAVKPLYFIMETAPPHRVLEYTGRTTPRLRTDGKWKDIDARTVFDWNSVGSAR